MFSLKSHFEPAGDQVQAIASLVQGIKNNYEQQTLLGATGTGKTFTMAQVIHQIQKPTLVIAHNKTLAAQLAQEFKEFFPDNAVHYFVSYYDYYQPEAYVPVTDTYIEKDASINEEIDRLRHASTQSLLMRNDVIIVASVSCIYGLGSPREYAEYYTQISVGDTMNRTDMIRRCIEIHYERTNADLHSGSFRAVGNTIEIMPVSQKTMYRIEFEGNKIMHIVEIDPVSSQMIQTPTSVFLFPAKHFMTDPVKMEQALVRIRTELDERLQILESEGKILEAERLRRRTNYDMAMMREIGYTNGIENYSRQLDGRMPGEAPATLLEYFPHTADGKPDFLTIIDESHVTLPQLRAMYAGDQARKKNLVDHGFRLPSALDNRPLQFHEFEARVGQRVYVSATPGVYEREHSQNIAEQIIRPTGLLDPVIEIRPVTPTEHSVGQVHDFIEETKKEISTGGRVLITMLTKKMAEDISGYLRDQGIRAEYLHSEIKTMERITIISDFRRGNFDCLVGVNLLREGLDMPEVSLIGILDGDKEGFLRSETSLIQTIGRAARNENGRVIIYADRMTDALRSACDETARRRAKQLAYNQQHGITPKTIQKEIKDIAEALMSRHEHAVQADLEAELHPLQKLKPRAQKTALQKIIRRKEKEMNASVKILDFETAALLRDEIKILENKLQQEK